jgi:hypothetical protein
MMKQMNVDLYNMVLIRFLLAVRKDVEVDFLTDAWLALRCESGDKLKIVGEYLADEYWRYWRVDGTAVGSITCYGLVHGQRSGAKFST